MQNPLTLDEVTRRATEVAALSQRMLADAEAGQWQTVAELELQRRHQLEQLFASPLPAHLLQQIQSEIEEIIRTDQAIVSLSGRARVNLAQDMRTVLKGRTAINAYQQNSR